MHVYRLDHGLETLIAMFYIKGGPKLGWPKFGHVVNILLRSLIDFCMLSGQRESEAPRRDVSISTSQALYAHATSTCLAYGTCGHSSPMRSHVAHQIACSILGSRSDYCNSLFQQKP